MTGRGRTCGFNREEIRELKRNPNVEGVSPTRITYTDRFKAHALASWQAGTPPKKIFEAAGFDVRMIGYKRVERAIARWREAGAKGTIVPAFDERVEQVEDADAFASARRSRGR